MSAATTRSTRWSVGSSSTAPSGHRLGLYVSGRAGFEIVQKAWAAGFSAVVAVSAPSAWPSTARGPGMTLAGFVRGPATPPSAGRRAGREARPLGCGWREQLTGWRRPSGSAARPNGAGLRSRTTTATWPRSRGPTGPTRKYAWTC